MIASAAVMFTYHHGSKISVIYLEIFNEKAAALGEMYKCKFTFQTLMVGHYHIGTYYKNNFNKIF